VDATNRQPGAAAIDPGGAPDATPATAFESAARLMSADVLVVEPSTTAAEIRALARRRRYASLSDIAVCEEGTLRGLIRIEDALAAADDAPATACMDADPPVVSHGVDQEVAAWKAVQHGESALAVIDDDGRFLGLIPPQRLLAVLLAEHAEDMARLGGFMAGAAAREASTEPVARRLLHRLPWLAVGLLGAIVAAGILDAFEGRLREHVLLAFFIPGVVYLADAVGTQTETLVIRGLSLGVTIRDVVAREIVTGVFAGALLAAAFLPVGLLWWGDGAVVATVCLSLLVACTLATTIATLLPWLFSLAGRDPAFGSGPLATVIQDLLSIVIYLSLASVLV
jgi:magnesium transporter